VKTQDVLLIVACFHFEIAQWHALRIKVAFVPSVKDMRNLKPLMAPLKTIRFLCLSVFVPSEYGDVLKLHIMTFPGKSVIPHHSASGIRNDAWFRAFRHQKL
jgi:hypothetical protein